MSQPVFIRIPQYYPTCCNDCPLCGTRPKAEVPDTDEGRKWTKICLYDHHLMSGRGCKSPTARNRCGLRKYAAHWNENKKREKDGSFYSSVPVAADDLTKYQAEQVKMLFPPEFMQIEKR